MDNAAEGYKPGEEFEADTNEPLVDFSLTDSTELWLIQWPLKELKPSDFHGKELKLKLHRDGNFGCLETSSGKSYDMVSFASQEPDATVFLPTSSESKVAGKISRRVCLRRYPDPEDFEQPSFRNPNLSNQRASGRSSSHRSTVMRGTKDSFALSPEPCRKRRREDGRSADRASQPESHVTDPSSASEKSKKKKRKMLQPDKVKRQMSVLDGRLRVHMEAVEARFLRASFSALVYLMVLSTQIIEEIGQKDDHLEHT